MKEKRSGDGDNGEIAGLDDNKAGDFLRENASKKASQCSLTGFEIHMKSGGLLTDVAQLFACHQVTFNVLQRNVFGFGN